MLVLPEKQITLVNKQDEKPHIAFDKSGSTLKNINNSQFYHPRLIISFPSLACWGVRRHWSINGPYVLGLQMILTSLSQSKILRCIWVTILIYLTFSQFLINVGLKHSHLNSTISSSSVCLSVLHLIYIHQCYYQWTRLL